MSLSGHQSLSGHLNLSGKRALACSQITYSRFRGAWVVLLLSAVMLSGCSVRKMAVRSVASGLADGTSVFATDPDFELVGQALPFTLKTIEALLEIDPENSELLLAACSGFTQYSYAYVELEAEKLKAGSFREASRQRRRSTGLYLRARDYCFQALDLIEPGTSKRLPLDPAAALSPFDRQHIDLLYWTGASWGSAISSARDRPEIMVDLPVVRDVFELLLNMDEDYGKGVLHDAMISLEAVPEAMGGSPERAKKHYERSVELSRGTRAGTHLAWAWLVTIGQQDREGFELALEKALAVDLDLSPSDRLANAVNQSFATYLLSQADDLFLSDEGFDDFTEDSIENEPISEGFP